jgi:hypothetical protein
LESEQAEIVYDGEGDEPEPVSESRADQVLDQHELRLMRIRGVEGVGVEQDFAGTERIVIYVRDSAVSRNLPATLDGVPIRVEVSGEFKAQ